MTESEVKKISASIPQETLNKLEEKDIIIEQKQLD